MPLDITFTLSDQDLGHFQTIVDKAKSAMQDDHNAEAIEAAAKQLIADANEGDLPAFIGDRLAKLEVIINMVGDEEWQLSDEDRSRVLGALVYFCDPEDLIPDSIPGIGYLDDAIMVELALKELRHEIEGYDDFREFRDKYDTGFRLRNDPDKRAAKLEARRLQLRERIARRRARDEEAAADTARLL